MPRNLNNPTGLAKTKEAEASRRAKLSRLAKSRIELSPSEHHWRAKRFILIAPDRKIYEFINLNNFVREHPELFNPDDLIPYKGYGTNGWCRAMSSLTSLFRKNPPAFTWRGWKGPRDPEYLQILQVQRKFPVSCDL